MPIDRRLAAFLLAALLGVTAGACDHRAEARCFASGAAPPERQATLADTHLGASVRDLAAALFDRDLDRAETLLRTDPSLAAAKVNAHNDMLAVALASCEPRAVALLLRHGAPADGDGRGVTLSLALMMDDPVYAHSLLKAGASPMPAGNPLAAFRTATGLGSLGGVKMLLDFGADPNVTEGLGHRPLQTALDMDQFRIAELLLDRGADPWAIDSGGGNLGTAAFTPMVLVDAEEQAAQKRIQARLQTLRWPSPPPPPEQIRTLALDRRWPPAGIKAPPVPAEVLEQIAENEGKPPRTLH